MDGDAAGSHCEQLAMTPRLAMRRSYSSRLPTRPRWTAASMPKSTLPGWTRANAYLP